jgi:hypothetical protein
MSKEKTIKEHKIAALQWAYKQIKNDCSYYICYALNDYYFKVDNSKKSQKAVYYLTNYISKALKGYTFLDNWLVDKENLKWAKVSNTDKIRRTRLAWIEWMLAAYGAKP